MEILSDSKWNISGKIVFNIGAFSQVGSSESIFSKSTKILLELLYTNLKGDLQRDERTIIESELNN